MWVLAIVVVLENHIMLASKLTKTSLYILLNPVCQMTTSSLTRHSRDCHWIHPLLQAQCQSQGLPYDSPSLEIGLIRVILDRCGHFLIIDPNGLNPVCQKTTFLDKAFIKTLGGMCVLEHTSCWECKLELALLFSYNWTKRSSARWPLVSQVRQSQRFSTSFLSFARIAFAFYHA